ncbi:hypothetical protein ACE1SV_62440 [Streptomyces sennicomposti]
MTLPQPTRCDAARSRRAGPGSGSTLRTLPEGPTSAKRTQVQRPYSAPMSGHTSPGRTSAATPTTSSSPQLMRRADQVSAAAVPDARRARKTDTPLFLPAVSGSERRTVIGALPRCAS